jgi:hypothetical protein
MRAPERRVVPDGAPDAAPIAASPASTA